MIGVLTLLLGLAPAGPVIAPSDFDRWFQAAAAGRLNIPSAVERDARRFRYVFVAGFCNERTSGYFAQNIRELRARGVPRGSIHVISPSSHRTIGENAEAIRSKFLAIASEGPEELVVIAHSRGACDALAFALEDPGFVRDRVRALFLVQGPFGGSGVADYVTGEGPPMDRRMPARFRLMAHLLGKFEELILGRGRHGGLRGMARDASRDFWARMLAEHADAVPVVGPKTFFVTSRVETARLRFFRRAIGTYLSTYFGPNDGMVALCDQSLPGLGTVLTPLDLGHTDLTHRFPSTRAPRRIRKALIRSILMAVGRDDPW